VITGGTGVTFITSHLLSLLRHPPQQAQNIQFIWHIRHSSDISWLTYLLNEAAVLSATLPRVTLTVDIYVTKSHSSDEPSSTVESVTHRVDESPPPCRPKLLDATHNSSEMIVKEGRAASQEPSIGLSPEVTALIRWNRGRADLHSIIQNGLDRTTGRMHVTGTSKPRIALMYLQYVVQRT
jgi:ferric-chelate reductase